MARWWVTSDTYKPTEYREYGDPPNMLDRLVAGVLGDGWQPVVDGADDDIPDMPDLPPEPEELAADAGDLERRVHAMRLERWERDAERIVTGWEQAIRTQPFAQQRQDEIRAWADRVHLRIRMRLWERQAHGLGDGVLVLWPQAADWPRLEAIHPAGFFPDQDEHDDGEFPRHLPLAWEYEETKPDGTTERRLRRITFTLVEIASLRIGTDRTGAPTWIGPDGEPVDAPALADDERIDPQTGRIYRLYPWQLAAPEGEWKPGDTPNYTLPDDVEEADVWSPYTCILSDGTWPLDAVGNDLNALDDSRATWRVLDDGTMVHGLDLRCDFIPVIHRPGRVVDEGLYGAGVFDTASQVLDDLADADTGVARAAKYLPDPTVVVAGITLKGDEQVKPGRLFGTTDKGGFDVVDFAGNHQQASVHRDSLAERALQSVGLPRELVGKVDSSDVASGVALQLAFGPYGQLVVESRETGGPKHELLYRMAQRLAQAARVLPPGPTPTVRTAYGPYLPTDRTAAVKEVTDSLRDKAISRQTGVRILVAAGFPIDDARAEVDRIAAEDTAGAAEFADAIAGAPNQLDLVADRLGVEVTGRTPDQPTITLNPGASDGEDTVQE